MSQVYITQKSAMSLTFEIEILPKRLRGREDFMDEIWDKLNQTGKAMLQTGFLPPIFVSFEHLTY